MIRDLQTSSTFFYDFAFSPAQQFVFDGDNAFFGQRLAVAGRDSSGTIARSEFITFEYTSAVAVPEPSTTALLVFASLGLLSRTKGLRYLRDRKTRISTI